MQSSISVLTPAEDTNLITLYEARLALNMAGSTDLVSDEQIELLIRWTSDEIATYCNRVFARERVVETYRDLDNNRIFLSRYPVISLDEVDDGGTILAASEYELDVDKGRLLRLGGAWSDPVKITYTGGYDLPFQSPVAVVQAALLLVREGYYAATRGDATTRMISHKDSRVIYFDPNARGGAAGGGAGINPVGSPQRKAVYDLLHHYMRFWI